MEFSPARGQRVAIVASAAGAKPEWLRGVAIQPLEAAMPRRDALGHGPEQGSAWLLLEGSAYASIGGALVALPRRRLCILRDASVTVHADGRPRLLGAIFHLADLDAWLRRGARASYLPGRVLVPEAARSPRGLIPDLRLRLAGQPLLQRNDLLGNWLEQQLLEIASEQSRRVQALIERSPGRRFAERYRSFRRLALAREILQMDGGEKLPITELAAIACYSPSCFVRAFQRVFGRSPADIRQERRLQLAGRMLAHTRLSINEVAEEVGYSNRSAFSRMFREAMGVSASAFRDARQSPRVALGG